ncbi:MAG: GNAT family N-acetyltransferase [Firmicutes bacterium]|nr:GNAT family N-acetyltransferase [Bacillota bacterium]
MEKFYLEEPTIKRKNDALEYLNELAEFGSELNGTGSMDRCLTGWTYEEFLVENEKRKDKNYAYSINRCPSKTFFFIRQNDNKIVGMINIRYDISQELLENGASHIGYSIRPTERRKGYNKIQLYLGLLEEQKIGVKRVLLNCTVDNIGSNKSILSLGGVLEKTELDKNDNTLTNYYWIDVDKSISENKKIYFI